MLSGCPNTDVTSSIPFPSVPSRKNRSSRLNDKPPTPNLRKITQGAAAYDYTEYFKLPKNKGNFKSLCHLSISFSMDSHSKASYYKIVNKKYKEISEEKYNKLLKKYRKPVKLTFYDADSKAVDNLRNGIVIKFPLFFGSLKYSV